jgi:hypothetical protein
VTYRLDLTALLNHSDEDTLVMGNFNAHHEAWDSTLSDSRGETISDAIVLSPLVILNNPDVPTRLPRNVAPSSPDLAVASAHIALASTWSMHIRLNSNHLPMTIALPCELAQSPRTAKTYTNFKKADWPAFIRESEAAFRNQPKPTSVSSGEKVFRKILLTASKHAVPSSYRRECVPGISREASVLISERDELRSIDPTDPGIEVLNQSINKIISENKRSL